MKYLKFLISIFIFSVLLVGCYTILKHPEVRKNGYSHSVKFYNDCSSCHSSSELASYGYEHFESYPYASTMPPMYLYYEPVYTPPWWMGLQIPVSEPTQPRNDETRLRNNDGGRTSAPSNFSMPSRSTSSTNSSSSSNSSTTNSNDSNKERTSRSSDTPNSRNNSGERKK